MPEARRPGTRTRLSVGPPRPDASMRKKAPTIGEPIRALMAAKLPAAATTIVVLGGASLAETRTAQNARPPPRAMSGASGPRTTPDASVANAARTIPGSWIGVGGPAPALNPSAGEWPPAPGKKRTVTPTSTPAIASGKSGHHTGTWLNPSHFGRSEALYVHVWRRSTR